MIAQLNASCFMGQRIIIMSICCMGHKSGLYFLSWKNVDTSTFVNDFAHIMCHQNLLCYIRLKWCCWPSKVAILFLLRCLGLQGATFLHLILHNIFQMLDDGHDVCVCMCMTLSEPNNTTKHIYLAEDSSELIWIFLRQEKNSRKRSNISLLMLTKCVSTYSQQQQLSVFGLAFASDCMLPFHFRRFSRKNVLFLPIVYSGVNRGDFQRRPSSMFHC